MTLASIIRILGNENPPRDVFGQREQVLRQLLTKEPTYPNVTKWYLLNRLFDRTYRRQLCETLDQHNGHYITFGFDYSTPANEKQLRVAGINLNTARNYAAKAGIALARYAVVLDGDCGFTEEGWAPVAEAMQQDTHRYLSIPHRRHGTEAQGEPMLAFRDDSDLRFDERISFGQGDKLELLFRLGHERTPYSGHLKITGNLTKLVGEVLHYGTGDDKLEKSLVDREKLRNESMHQFELRVRDWPRIEFRVFGPHSEVWKQIDGFFDFSGPYSGFALDAPDNAHFVEVGSWQGKSVIYLATQLRAMGKRARIDAVDTWDGGQDKVLQLKVAEIGGPAALFASFQANVQKAGFEGQINPVRLDSVAAAAQYADNSLDMVYLDGGHSYEQVLADLNAWYPKVKLGGVIGGHDFVFEHPVSRAGVVRAVLEFFADKPLEVLPHARTWKSVKYGEEPLNERKRRWC